jgi:hypothetical protein
VFGIGSRLQRSLRAQPPVDTLTSMPSQYDGKCLVALPWVARLMRIASHMVESFLPVRIRSAQLLVITMPLSTEIPMSATRSAIQSWMPSPSMPTESPRDFTGRTTSPFCFGVSFCEDCCVLHGVAKVFAGGFREFRAGNGLQTLFEVTHRSKYPSRCRSSCWHVRCLRSGS